MSFSSNSTRENIRSGAQAFYRRDPAFQLELNLQMIRLALIFLTESHDEECMYCNKLICECQEDWVSVTSSNWYPGSVSWSLDSSESEYFTAPPPDALPNPDWSYIKSVSRITPEVVRYNGQTEIESWVRASVPGFRFGPDMRFPTLHHINSEINRSWPALPGSIWRNESFEQLDAEQEVPTAVVPDVFKEMTPTVREFFRHFTGA